MANKGEIARKKVCRRCNEIKKCSTYWGNDCKRNGGKKIPRHKLNKPEFILRHKRDYLFEPIYTPKISGF